MNTERMSIEGRAARHAALADPVRLRVVDLLARGDASPVELQSRLGVTSNLLAHHLNILEQGGIISRSRSEADRRRNYVRLVPGALDGLLPHQLTPVQRIVFVCTANSARSQLAAALWQRTSPVPATSAGTHPADAIEPRAIAAADRHGLELPSRKPRALAEVLGASDLLVTVCDRAHEELGLTDGLHWSVPDPVRAGTDRAFDAALDDLARRIEGLAPQVTTP